MAVRNTSLKRYSSEISRLGRRRSAHAMYGPEPIGRQTVQCKGRVQGNVVILEEGVHLPDGTPVTVMVEQREMAEQEEITQEELAQRHALVAQMKAFGQRLVGRHVSLGDLILEGREELEDRA